MLGMADTRGVVVDCAETMATISSRVAANFRLFIYKYN